MDNQLVTLPSDIKNANTIKCVVLAQLLRDKAITDIQAENYSTSWQIIIVKKSWFKRWMDKFSSKEDGYAYKFVQFEDNKESNIDELNVLVGE